MSDIFISYSHLDKEYAHKLHRHLNDKGFDAWIDDRIDYGSHWPLEIEKRLRECVAFILIMSPSSYESEWVQNELSFARRLNKRIFPLLLDGDVWWHLETTQYVDVKNSKLPPAKFFDRLADIVQGHEIGGSPGDEMNAPDEVLPPEDDLIAKKEEQELKLKKLENQAIQNEQKADFRNALNCWYEIKRIDPSFPRVDIKIGELEGELRREKEERERKALQEKEKREAVREKVKREKAERRAAQWAALEKNFSTALDDLQNDARRILAKFQNKIVLSILSFIFFVAVIGYALYNQGSSLSLFFSGDAGGEVNIYAYKGDRITKITQTTAGAENWAPANGVGGNIYFTSNRSGRAEIYGFNSNTGDLWQITTTPGGYESWSPAIGIDGNIYFTSNRSGKAEIYGFDTIKGNLWQITTTPGKAESWSPAIGTGGIIYFTSNRTGKAEIFRFNTNTGELRQITDTPGGAESWSPAISFGNLYFTSNRTGKAEVYQFNTNTGKLQQVTDTPGQSESWAPVVLGNKIYITSNRSGQTRVYLLNHEEVSISDFTSWTKKINDRVPGY